MTDLLNEFITDILSLDEAKPAKVSPVPKGLFAGPFGKYYTDKELQSYAGKVSAGKWVPATKPVKTTKSTKPLAKTTTQVKSKQPAGTKSAVPKSKAPGTIPPKQLGARAITRDTELLTSTSKTMMDRGFSSNNDKQRFTTFVKLWRAFLSAPSYEEQVKAVRAMADLKMIEGGASGKKIYVTPTTGLTPKHMCGAAGTSVTKLMNDIISQESIEIGTRGNSADRALADLSGKHNEAGVTKHLFPNKENNAAYDSVIARYQQFGGDISAADERNKVAANSIRAALPKGAKITSAIQVGGVGKTALNKLGIDPKTDPTDILLEYEVNGKKEIMKISAKIYTDPRNITMKNSGVRRAGEIYLGQPEGEKIDTLWKSLSQKYKWTPDTPDEEKVKIKSKLKQEYLKNYAAEMENLSKTPKGQQRLLDMWRSVHGCGKDVHTLVINKSTNQSELKSPAYYCDPKVPFKVRYDGIKVVIEMNTGGPQTLQIDLKTEDRGSPKLLFRHIIRDKK